MITSPAFAGKRYAVLGLARSGTATLNALIASGAKVTAWDSNEERLAQIKAHFGVERDPPGSGINFLHPPARLTFADPLEIDLTGFDGVVVSPGVPLNTHPIAAHAKAAGVPVIGDIELFAQARPSLPPHKVVGITGTNGKSTTTALIHHILQTAGVPTTMGGNIGLPILGQEPLPEGGVYVLELSSFQIDLTFSLDCDVAVLTNITPDHLDRYDGFEAYAASKARLFAMQSAGNVAVVTDGDAPSAAVARSLQSEGRLQVFRMAHERSTKQQDWPSLQGPHNLQNAYCALTVAAALGIDIEGVLEAFKTYPGLPHRMERIAEIDGVLYVNDSKATNATSTAPALGAYPKIHWIAGGRRKTDDLDACAPFYGHVVAAYTIGEATDLYADILRRAGIATLTSGTLALAVKQAAACVI